MAMAADSRRCGGDLLETVETTAEANEGGGCVATYSKEGPQGRLVVGADRRSTASSGRPRGTGRLTGLGNRRLNGRAA